MEGEQRASRAPAREPSEREVTAIITLGECLHAAGTPTRRLEVALVTVAQQLGMRIHVFATVTGLIVAFGAESIRTVLVRLDPRDLDLGQLVRLDAVLQSCLQRRDGPDELLKRLRAATADRTQVSVHAMIAMRCAGAAAWTLLLGGAWRAAAASGLAGVAIGAISALLRQADGSASAETPALAGLLTGLSVALGDLLWGPLPRELACMAALLPLLPGLPLVIGVEELASRDLLAGCSRLLGAALTFLQLAFGVALGSKLLHSAGAVQIAVQAPPPWEQAVLLVVAVRVLSLQLSVERVDLPWVFAAGLLGYACARLGSTLLGLELGAFLGALMIGGFANAVARWWERPALLVSVPGMFALWPGALGFLTVNALWSDHAVSGVRQALSVMMTAVGAVTGLLVSARVLPPRRML